MSMMYSIENTLVILGLCVYSSYQSGKTACEVCLCSKLGNDTWTVNCDGKFLQMVPRGIPPKTISLNLKFNSLNSTNGQLHQLEYLEMLDMSSNPLCDLNSSDFYRLNRLKSLKLRRIPFCSCDQILTRNILPNPQNLVNLELDFIDSLYVNCSRKIPNEALLFMKNLEHLYINQFFLPFPKETNMNKLKMLDIATDSCPYVFTEDMLRSVPNVERLTFICSIHGKDGQIHISPKLFLFLSSLHTVDMKFPGVGFVFQMLIAVSRTSSVHSIGISMVRYTKGQTCNNYTKLLSILNDSEITDIRLEDNQMKEWSFVSYLPPSVKTLSVPTNMLNFQDLCFANFDNVPNLETLDATRQYTVLQSGKPKACNLTRTVLKSPNTSSLQRVYFSSIPDPSCLPLFLIHKTDLFKKVKTLQLSNGYIPQKSISTSFNDTFPFLENLTLSGSTLGAPTSYGFSSSLRTLNLDGSSIPVTELTYTMFPQCENLRSLNMARIGIKTVAKDFLLPFSHIKILKLNSNAISKFETRVLNAKHLNLLDISNNYIQILTKEVVDDLEEIASSFNSKLFVDLSGNLLICSCATIKLLRLIRSSEVHFNNKSNYTCHFTNGSVEKMGNLDWLPGMELECQSFTELIVGTIAVILIFLCITVGVLVYRFRWKFRYIYYMVKLAFPKQQSRTGYGKVFEFDAFISYAEGDDKIVRQSMIQKLEKEAGFRLCVHQRDFLPGNPIAQNISQAVHNSRRTVILLSRKYLISEWCMYELNMARMEDVYSDRKVILVIMLEDIPASQIPVDVLDLIRSQTYVEYPNNTENVDAFWITIRECLLAN